MTSSSKPRLYKPPDHTIETLKAVISGSNSKKQIADQLEVTPKTAETKIHDPLHLGLIEKEDDRYEATDEARRLVQLQDDDILKDRFVNLPGVTKVLERIEDGGANVEEVGRVISFKTESGAAKEETFRHYGRVYAQWLDRLDLGEVDGANSQSQHPLENDRGANAPRVRPQKLIEALRVVDNADDISELADQLDHSERTAQKILTTAYALRIVESERGGGFSTTETGRTITTTSQGKQRELLRNKLLEIPLVQAYCNRVPDGEFKNRNVMELVSEEYSLGWSEGTVETRAKRLYQWLLFTNLAEEKKQGTFKATDKMPRGNLPDP